VGLFLDSYSDNLAKSKSGASELKIKEMGSRYLFICLYVWLEKYFSRGDYRKNDAVGRERVEIPAKK
jgi:hypothetical protein